MHKIWFFFLFVGLLPVAAQAQGVAPEMFGVREIILDYARFDNPKAADICGLSREQVALTLHSALTGTNVPVIDVGEARPPALGMARIQLIPEIYVHTDENMDCVSLVSLSAESHANTIIPPVSVPRTITAVYWHQRVMLASSQSLHPQTVNDVLKKMLAQFAQQYRIDQPPELPK